jgi:RHS repeat-associated protein
LLDGRPAPVRVISTGNTNAPYQWRATLDLTPGAHQLQVNAVHPSGQFSTNATLWFTNKVTQLAATDSFDAAGYLTNRVWKNPGGKTNRVQSLAWDARGRLYRITDRITQFSNTVAIATNGVELTATYDALGRLLRTREIPISNNVALASQPTVIDRYYDPQVEFLEVGVSENGRTTWKLMGPDTDGVYGGQNGTGGFEAIVPGPELFCPILSDAHGNLHAVYDQTHANLMWYASRLTGYGAVPGYQSVPLGQASADLGAKYVWRNRAMTSVGLSWMGGNWYDPVAGQFLSFDPAGHAGSDSGYSFCSGNPYGFWDPDGRFTKQAATVTAGWAYDQLYGAGAILTTVSAGIIGDSLNVVGPAVGNPHLGDWFNQWSQYYHNNSAPAAQAGLYDASDPNIQAASFGLALATLRPGMAPTPVTTANRALMLPAEDATLAGSRTLGYTTPSGEVFLQPGLSRAEQLSTLRHESIHAFFSPPGNGAVATFRQNLGQWGHDNSAFLNATEEIIAETHASGSLSRGLGHAFNGAYTVRGGTVVTPWNFIGEGTAIGGLGVGGYYLGNNLFGGKQ